MEFDYITALPSYPFSCGSFFRSLVADRSQERVTVVMNLTDSSFNSA